MNDRFFDLVIAGSAGVKAALNQVSAGLETDDIEAALEATSGDGLSSYMNTLVTWHDAITVYLVQASVADSLTSGGSFGQARMRTLKEEIELKTMESELLQRFNDLYLKILVLEFTGPADVFYIAERQKVLKMIQSVIAKMDQFLMVLSGLDSQLANVTLNPVLAVQTTSLSSEKMN